jgi:hypothetical protein
MALSAVGHSGSFRVCLMEKVERLMLVRIEHARKNHPAD